MSKESPRHNHPEAIANILLRILEKTPLGGATIEDIEDAYCEIKGRVPSRKTLYRAIRRLELLFNPLAGEVFDDDEDEEPGWIDGDYGPSDVGIKRVKRSGKTYYIFEGRLPAPAFNYNESLFTAISLYPQQRAVLKSAFKKVLKKLLSNTLAGVSVYTSLLNEINTFVHIAEPFPADPEKFGFLVSEIFRALRQKNRIRITYVRTYDGRVTERVIEPYGLLIRFNNYYLAGFCLENNEPRIFHLVHIRELQVLEDSYYEIPDGYSLKKAYSQAWATWTTVEPGPAETVRLRVNKGAAERFRAIKFHESQRVVEQPDGSIEVSFRLTGAQEIIPWLVSWGAEIRVIKPDWLWEEARSYVQETLEWYGEKDCM